MKLLATFYPIGLSRDDFNYFHEELWKDDKGYIIEGEYAFRRTNRRRLTDAEAAQWWLENGFHEPGEDVRWVREGAGNFVPEVPCCPFPEVAEIHASWTA